MRRNDQATIADLYLDSVQVGLPWLLRPDSELVRKLLHDGWDRTSTDRCDHQAVLADLDDLENLIMERHFGIATGELDPRLVTNVLAHWRNGLRAEQPATWGRALATWVHRLRWALRDNHLTITGEDQALLATVDSRRNEPRTEREPGPVVQESVIDGVLCVRIRQCGGLSRSSQDLMRAWQQDNDRHFAHDRIVVDLRANPGGEDRWINGWIRDHISAEVVFPPWREWRINDQPLNEWNIAVLTETLVGPEDVPVDHDRSGIQLDHGTEFQVVAESFSIPAAARPWHGRMLVLTDPGTASAAESGAWMLRAGFGARLVGGRSSGAVSYGNLAPYLLPRSGLMINLPTASAGRPDESMVGIPVDLPFDVHTSLDEFAADFEDIFAAAGSERSDRRT